MPIGGRFLSRRGMRTSVVAIVAPLLAGGVALSTKRSAHAEDATADKAEASERCAVRLSIAVTGKAADDGLLNNPDPASAVDGMLGSPDFADRYASFVNSETNGA